MDELKPEDDLKPDTSDRRPTRSRKASSGPKIAVSRQHIMIGIGILVLLLIIIAIGSALKAPTQHEASQQNPNVAARDINLADSSSLTSGAQTNMTNSTSDGHDGSGVNNSGQPQAINVPAISSTPTEAPPLANGNAATQRVDLPGNMSDALSQQQGQVDSLSQDLNGAVSTLPTAPATVSSSTALKAPAVRESTTKPAQNLANGANKQTATVHKNVTAVGKAPSKNTSVASNNNGSLTSVPGSHFTLQLSSASRSDTLNAYAKQQKLTNYQVYETKRDGKPWYVLVSGNYASSAEAKRAIGSLPADVQAKKPWVKPVHQVQKDLKK
ncbi:SPOR domain-containing protein [Yersinia ruckeri]|uniref:SPOR domain-containing protein n=1 Tax=Yersinia ruckeri TaxID=29486 RepID=UPI0011A0ED83|nr:SPOR domain-containing protein [Yersinia ruckeri]EKN3345819.1 SPOR domain-containing protein [Yersinia ruckeri]EKN4207293.1 SPOR domain-containing protein [Yersinia ruckeri]ELM3746698.1 SPOR domain-containing protein [Yersinia ruckeri]MCK8561418.1 SPOR domain-containing protein [Yersinia ruckeri]MCW6549523.1 SPOR domain-containing protein [Yersinia ruckeri]